jgi:hypothetical protein
MYKEGKEGGGRAGGGGGGGGGGEDKVINHVRQIPSNEMGRFYVSRRSGRFSPT